MISKQEILNAGILIVDDQQANVLLLEDMLVEAGYTRIASTVDPFAVCGLQQQNRYDLILLDLQMPGLDGFQVMDQLKETDPEGYLPVLAITAQPSHKLHALAKGAKDFIAKPFDVVELKTRIHNMLEVRLLYKQLEHYNKRLEQTVLERTAELCESEARYRRLTELSSDWYWEQDENGHFIRIFGAALEMLGFRVDAELGNVREDYELGWNERERDILVENLAAKRPFLDFVYRRFSPDGTQKYLMVSGEPVFDASGRFISYRGVGKDVTESMAGGK